VLATAARNSLGERSFVLHTTAGAWAVVYTTASNQDGTDRTVAVRDVRSGRSHNVFSSRCVFDDCQGQPALSVVRINDSGQSVTAMTNEGGVWLVAASSTGAERTLEAAPAAELAVASVGLEGSTVRWVRNGVPRSAEIIE
jgi:hypothetical protein